VNGTPYQAQVVSNNFNQVVCISPSITPSGLTNPSIPATVTVTNVGSGKVSAPGLTFTYGQGLFISGISPMQGPAGTSVTITGQGFVGPVTVIWGGGTPWTVLSVAGTQVVAQAAPLASPQQCTGGSGTIKVTNLDSGLNTTSTDSFTYQGVNPLITSIVVSNCGAGSGNTVPGNQSPCTLTVNGSNFGSNMQLSLANPITTIAENVGGASTQAVFTLTNSLEGLGIKYDTAACTNGTQNLITPIDVTIKDTASSCTNTLAGGLLVSPSNAACVVPPPAPILTITPTTVTLSAATLPGTVHFSVTVTNPGASTVALVSTGGNLLFTPAVTSVNLTPLGGFLTGGFDVTINSGTAGQNATFTLNYSGAVPQSATITLTP